MAKAKKNLNFIDKEKIKTIKRRYFKEKRKFFRRFNILYTVCLVIIVFVIGLLTTCQVISAPWRLHVVEI